MPISPWRMQRKENGMPDMQGMQDLKNRIPLPPGVPRKRSSGRSRRPKPGRAKALLNAGFILLMIGVIGFAVYQLGTLITTGSLGAGFLPGLIAVAVMIGIVIQLCIRADKNAKPERTLSGKK